MIWEYAYVLVKDVFIFKGALSIFVFEGSLMMMMHIAH